MSSIRCSIASVVLKNIESSLISLELSGARSSCPEYSARVQFSGPSLLTPMMCSPAGIVADPASSSPDDFRSYCQMLCMETSGGDLILPDSVDEFHIFNDLTQAAIAL